jgi:hypothetical protein
MSYIIYISQCQDNNGTYRLGHTKSQLNFLEIIKKSYHGNLIYHYLVPMKFGPCLFKIIMYRLNVYHIPKNGRIIRTSLDTLQYIINQSIIDMTGTLTLSEEKVIEIKGVKYPFLQIEQIFTNNGNTDNWIHPFIFTKFLKDIDPDGSSEDEK